MNKLTSHANLLLTNYLADVIQKIYLLTAIFEFGLREKFHSDNGIEVVHDYNNKTHAEINSIRIAD